LETRIRIDFSVGSRAASEARISEFIVSSLEVLGVSFDFPVHEALEVIEDHMFVAFYLLVSKHDAQVHTGRVHLVLVFHLVLAKEFKMVLQDVRRLLHITLSSFFVIK
jgi:hypothetical protein